MKKTECWHYRMSANVLAAACKKCVYHQKRRERHIPETVRCWEYIDCVEPCTIRSELKKLIPTEGTRYELLGHGRRALVLDDSRTLRNLLKLLLEEYEYVVDLASTGREAIEKSNKGHPDLLLCDINLAGSALSGLDVLAQVRKFKKEMKVIMLSSKADRETVEYCLKNGATAFVRKPFNNDNLIRRIAEALASKP